MITPIALIHATVYGMMDRGFGRIVNITSASIKHPIAALELSNGARLGLTGAVAVLARKASSSNVTINGILPGPFDTDRLRGTTQKMAEARKVALSVVEAERKAAVPAGRFGIGRGVRRRRRVPVLGARRLHHRPERADRRRRLSGLAVSSAGRSTRFRGRDRSSACDILFRCARSNSCGACEDTRGVPSCAGSPESSRGI